MNLRASLSSNLSSLLVSPAIAALVLLPSACGGKGESAGGATTPGQSQGGGDMGAGAAGMGAADAGVMPADAAPPPAAVTFVLKNTAEEELAFDMNKGWQPNIFAYSGKPPKAKLILMFPTFCTAACTAEDADRCPVCEQPDKVKDVIAAQKVEKVAPGAELDVPWDGQAFVYQKTKAMVDGKRKRCQCYSTEPAPAATYTVKACGLRITTEVGKASTQQCATGEMTLPVTEPVRVELEFPAPPPPPGKHHRGRHHH